MDLDLTLNVNLEKGISDLEKLVHSHVPTATMHSTPNTLFFTLPFNFTGKFPQLFQDLELVDAHNGLSFANACGARSYGIAMTTLEQVFLRLGNSQISF